MRCLLVEDEQKLADFVSRGLRAERFVIDVAPDAPGFHPPDGVRR